ncbi:mRNA decapping protein 2, Box A [Ascosphaera apis ARSEF 7405]|uniref:mRNA decapping protein 2, Box A n=1 Tax=Ascosphaera apis ARSEF 7405 TaxID=392613 RepID=A0A168A926_9EURO|nr:mRNA decapping protein 2, Box A [Ascosphaera apis ARSEF 7405]
MQDKDMKLEDWLDDLCVRFIINLPQEELVSVERICFQVEEAQWFYEDFIRPLDPNLPSLSLKEFSMKIFAHCPLMSQWSPYHHAAAFSEFMAYKTRVPVRGAILLNEEMDKCVLVKGYKKNANWSFPRGKINKDEADLDCAIREVYEETGFDIREAGLLTDKTEDEYIEIPMREQNMRLYVIRGVSMDTHFEPRTRKEISRIEWYKISDLPAAKRKQQQQIQNDKSQQQQQQQQQQQSGPIPQNKFYMVAPFLARLKRMIRDHKRNDAREKGDATNVQYPSGTEAMTEEEDLPSASRKRRSGAARTPALSEVPEAPTPLDNVATAAAAADPMATLKQVLNISGGGVAATSDDEKRDIEQSINEDGEKSRTLLGLLRSGSASTTATPPIDTTRPPPQPFNTIEMGNFAPQLPQQQMLPSGYPYPPPPPPPALSGPPIPPPFMSHIPPGQQLPNPLHSPFPPFMPPPGPHPAYDPATLPPPMPPYPNTSFPVPHPSFMAPQLPNPLLNFPLVHPGLPPQTAPPTQHLHQPEPTTQGVATARSPLAAAAAPYQRTGDPQFAQSEQQRGIGGFASAIPSASKLPPPKLSSHSLGLLSVLRGEKASDTTTANVPSAIVRNGDIEAEKVNNVNTVTDGNAAGDLLALLNRKPAVESDGATASAATVVTAGNPSHAGQNYTQAQPQSRVHVQAQSITSLPHRPKDDAPSRRRTPHQQFNERGDRSMSGGDRAHDAGFSDSGRRSGSGNGRRGGMRTTLTPDTNRRGRRDRAKELEKEKEREKMKNVTILARPKSQNQTSEEKKHGYSSAEGKTTSSNPSQQPHEQRQQQSTLPRARSQTFQPQRILKRPDPANAAVTAVDNTETDTGLETVPIPASDSKRLPGETIAVGSFAKPAKYGRPAIAAEPVKVGDVPRIIQRRKIPTFDNNGEEEVKNKEDTFNVGVPEKREPVRRAVQEESSPVSGDGQKDALLNLFARAADKPQTKQLQGQPRIEGQSQKEAQVQISPADATPLAPSPAAVTDSKAFLLGYLNSVASQGGSR